MAIKINGATVINDSQAITSTSTVSATGNITGGNVLTAGIISATGNITTSGTITATVIVANITPPAGGAISTTGNITGGNILNNGLISSTGNSTAGNYITAGLISATSTVTGSQFNGSAAGLTSIPAGNVVGTLTSTVLGNSTAYIGTTGIALNRASGALTLAGVSLSTLTIGTGLSGSSYNGSGAVTIATNQDISTGASPTFAGITVPSITHSGASGTGNIGALGAAFNTVFATATTAQYADLAENYLGDAAYVPGTVLDFGGEQEVTLSTADSSRRVAGVVSTNPAHLMNSALDGAHVTALALVGRVPTQVTGTVAKGDLMVSAGNGRARAEVNPATGTVIGKALENFNGSEGTIEIVICMQ
jgi:hypothetical protein